MASLKLSRFSIKPSSGFSAERPLMSSHSAGTSISLRPIEILLVEDSPSDTELTVEALRDGKLRNNLSIVQDGVQAMQFLRRQDPYANALRPDVILLDLNLPRKDGRELLAEIRADQKLATIPVVVMTVSVAEQDMLRAQHLFAESYITKPVEFGRFLEVLRTVESFYVFIVTLPQIPLPGSNPRLAS
jgi:chemotaxis family two-component system response regulator Rcp1